MKVMNQNSNIYQKKIKKNKEKKTTNAFSVLENYKI